MIDESKNAILDKIDQDDYESAYESCEDLSEELINSVCFNDVEKFRKILQYLNEIVNHANEKVKNLEEMDTLVLKINKYRYLFSMDEKLEKELNEGIIPESLKIILLSEDISITEKNNNEWVIIDKKKENIYFLMKEDGKLNLYENLVMMDKRESTEFLEKIIRTSYSEGAFSGFINCLCDIGSQFDDNSFVPHCTSMGDLLFLEDSPESLSYMHAIDGEGFLEHADDTHTFVAKLMKKNLIKLDENKTAFLTKKGNDLIKYYGMWKDIEYSQYLTKNRQVRGPFEIEETTLNVEEVGKLPLTLPLSRFIIPSQDIGRR